MPLRDPLVSSDDATSSSAPQKSTGVISGLSLGVPRSRAAAAARTASKGLAGNSTDNAVRQTDSDALLSRLSALKLGYLTSEPYTQELASSTSLAGPHASRRSPLINIGTYLRCSSIDAMVDGFLKTTSAPAQIVSIGAGSDSRYWRIMSSPNQAGRLGHYLEIDFAENTRLKMSRIGKSALLRSLVHDALETGQDSEQATSSKYSLRAADVRKIATMDKAGTEHIFGMLNPELPTLFLFECVLSYIDATSGDALIDWLSRHFGSMQAVVYDIGLAGDTVGSDEITRFGRVMLQNLEARHLTLTGASAYPSMSLQTKRFSTLKASTASSLYMIWQSLEPHQRTHLSRLEGLDEVEELEMLLRHYYLLQLC